jgi:hypothetical protein
MPQSAAECQKIYGSWCDDLEIRHVFTIAKESPIFRAQVH